MNKFIHLLHQYCEVHSSEPSQLLYELERETHMKTLAPQMISGPLQGRFLSLVSKMLRPQSILEIGTFTGYATLCLAEGLAPGGTIHTIEGNEELEYLIRKYIHKAGIEDQIRLYIGDALELIPNLPDAFDLVFIDAAKKDYGLFYDLIFDQLRPGGVILADNVLWSGKVIKNTTDEDTLAIKAFNQKIKHDQRVENILLPLRDGLFLIRKK